jgi:hypothetical protein
MHAVSVDSDPDDDLLRAALMGGRGRKKDPEGPGSVAARGVIHELVEQEALVLADGAEEFDLAERLLSFLEKTDAVAIAQAVGEWLLEQPDVDELFGDDTVVDAALRRHFSG